MEQGINIYVTGAHSFTQALITAVCYTATQDQRGAKASFYFVQIRAQLVPYCMMLVTLLFPGGAFTAMVMLTGLVAAHLFDFLTRIYPQFGGGPNLLPTPPFLSRLINTPRVNERAYGTAFRPGPAAGSGARTTGSSSGGGVLPDSWRSRGPGHRLGD